MLKIWSFQRYEVLWILTRCVCLSPNFKTSRFHSVWSALVKSSAGVWCIQAKVAWFSLPLVSYSVVSKLRLEAYPGHARLKKKNFAFRVKMWCEKGVVVLVPSQNKTTKVSVSFCKWGRTWTDYLVRKFWSYYLKNVAKLFNGQNMDKILCTNTHNNIDWAQITVMMLWSLFCCHYQINNDENFV